MLRKIPLLTALTDNRPDETGALVPLTWVFLIRQVLTAPRRGGIQVEEMRRVSKVLDALDVAENSRADRLILDDASWTYLRDAVNAHSWGAYLPSLIQFADDVAGADGFDPNAA